MIFDNVLLSRLARRANCRSDRPRARASARIRSPNVVASAIDVSASRSFPVAYHTLPRLTRPNYCPMDGVTSIAWLYTMYD